MSHDPAACWWCQHGLTLKSCVAARSSADDLAESDESYEASAALFEVNR